MSFQLPLELLNRTLSFLATDRSSLSSCSLVCKTWLPAARYHCLYTAYPVLILENKRISTFLELLRSPDTSLHLLPATELHLSQKGSVTVSVFELDGRDAYTKISHDRTNSPCIGACCVTPTQDRLWKMEKCVNDFFCWKSDDGRSFPTMFPSITTLHIEWLDWQTLSPSVHVSLYSDYFHSNITFLKLNDLAFQSLDDLPFFICAFPSLHTLHLLENLRSRRQWFIRPLEKPRCPSLRVIHLESPSTPIIDVLLGIQYDSDLSLLDISLPRHSQSEILQKCEALIQVLGPKLKALKLVKKRLVNFTKTDWASLYRLVSINSHLQELHLNMVMELNIVEFLQDHLSPQFTQNIHTLHFSFTERSKLRSPVQIDWKALDEILCDVVRFPKLRTFMFSMPYYAQYAITVGHDSYWEDSYWEEPEQVAENRAVVEIAKHLPRAYRRMDILLRKF